MIYIKVLASQIACKDLSVALVACYSFELFRFYDQVCFPSADASAIGTSRRL